MNDEDNPRWVTLAEAIQRFGSGGGNYSIIDLGIISAADVQREGVMTLIPYTPGRFVEEVFYTFDGYISEESTPQSTIELVTPNQALVSSTMVGTFGGDALADTKGCRSRGLLLDPSSIASTQDTAQILDTTPLYACSVLSGLYRPVATWEPNKAFDDTGFVLLVGGKIRIADTGDAGVGGVTGSIEPDWSSPDPITDDGTMNWSAPIEFPTAQIHAFAKVVDITGSELPIPTTIEWVVQPSDTVAGENITPAPQLRILDQNGDAYVFLAGLQYVLNPFLLGDGTLNGFATGYDPITGIVTYGNLNVTDPADGVILRAEFSGAGVDPADSDPFDVTTP